MRKFLIIACLTIVCSTVDAQIARHGLIALYHFSGNTSDSSGNGYHGTSHSATLCADRNGNQNQAYCFNGKTSYIDVGSHELFNRNNADYSVSAWIKSQDKDNKLPQTIMSNLGKTPDGISIVLFQPDSGKFAVKILGGKSASMQFSGEPFLADTNWHLITYTFEYRGNNKNPVSIYIDGTLNNSGALRNVKNPVHNTFIGFEPDSSTYPYTRFYGKMDDIAIYDRILNSEEVAAQFSGKMPEKIAEDEDVKKRKVLEQEIGVFPNPSIHKAFFIVNNYEHNVQVSIVNEEGKVVYKSSLLGNSRNKVALRDCKEGNYTINIKSLGGGFSKRIILQ